MATLDYHEADEAALAAALGTYYAQMAWNLTCVAASAAEREIAARNMASIRRLAYAATGEVLPLPVLGTVERRRIAESGADLRLLLLMLGASPGESPGLDPGPPPPSLDRARARAQAAHAARTEGDDPR